MTSTNQSVINSNITKCIEVLKSGGVILYPTDTVWGLGCDATNEYAVKKIFQIKQRSDTKSLISLVCDDGMLQKYVVEVPDLAWDIIDLSSKPTTIIYPQAQNIATNVIAQDGSIAIRMVKDGFCYQLIHQFGKAIVSTSANFSSKPTPFYFKDILPKISTHVDYGVDEIIDEGTHQPSSIIKLELNGEINVLRK